MEKELIQKYLNQKMRELNDQSLAYFEDYSPHEMHSILYHSFENDSIVSLKRMTNTDYDKSPMFMQMKSLAEIMIRENGIKLTPSGYLPPKFVVELYNQGHFKESSIEQGYTKLRKEADSVLIPLSRFILESSGVFSKKKGLLKLSKKGEKMTKEGSQLFNLLFTAFTNRLDWVSFCGYQMKDVGQLGVGFSLILLAKYGDAKNTDKFYGEKYLKAFPTLMVGHSKPTYSNTLEDWFGDCYSHRTFSSFLKYWGLINIVQDKYGSPKYIIKTEIFNKLIKCLPPKETL